MAENKFEFKVNIPAANIEEARELLNSSLILMQTARTKMSVKEFILFAKKIQQNPNLINTAKNFIL